MRNERALGVALGAALLAAALPRNARPELPASWRPRPQAAASPAAEDAFQSKVRPILARRCDPCHNPGGRMYDRLPFDKPEVVRENKAGILRRLKGEDRQTVEAWLGSGS